MNRVCSTALALLLVVATSARAEEARPSARPVKVSPESPSSSSGSGQSSSSGNASSSGSATVVTSRASGDGVLLALDLMFNIFGLAANVAILDEAISNAPPPPGDEAFAAQTFQRSSGDEEGPPPSWRDRRTRRHDARKGFLFSVGLGGGGLRASPDRTVGAFDFGMRMGYGFSDRFQLFGDFSLDAAQYPDGRTVSSWTLTARGQTVLIGDREGNGLNLNAGIGLGGVGRGLSNGCDGTYGGCYDNGQTASPTGLALAGGLSYDARLGRSFTLSPELFATWHQVPNGSGHDRDIATAVGVRFNFLWYLY